MSNNQEIKVGDIVEQVDDTGPGRAGSRFFVKNIDKEYCYVDAANGDGWRIYRFKKVSSSKSELEQLVETANSGLEALIKLSTRREEIRYSQRCDTGRNPVNACDSELLDLVAKRGWKDGQRFVAITKPTFTPYKTKDEGFTVKQFLDMIHVGCTEFPLEELKAALRALLHDDSGYSQGMSTVYSATKKGISTLRGSITWASAEELYEKIKDL